MKKLGKTSLLALLSAVSTAHADSLLESKASLGYDDVAYNAEDNTKYISLEEDTIKFRDITSNIPTTIGNPFQLIAIFDAQEGLEGYIGYTGLYGLESNGQINYIWEGGTVNLTTAITLNPNYNGSTEFVGGASNQADRTEFLAVYDNDAFGQFDSNGNLEFYFTDQDSNRKLLDVEGSVSDAGIFTGVLKYDNGEFLEVTTENQSALSKSEVPEAGALGNLEIAVSNGNVVLTAKNMDPNASQYRIQKKDDLAELGPWTDVDTFAPAKEREYSESLANKGFYRLTKY